MLKKLNLKRLFPILLVFSFLLCISSVSAINNVNFFNGTVKTSSTADASVGVVVAWQNTGPSSYNGYSGSYTVVNAGRYGDQGYMSITGDTGDTITFTICTRTAAETATFVDGGHTDLDLSTSEACPSGGGGGGGGGAGIPSVINLEASAGFRTSVGAVVATTQGTKLTFIVDGATYTITISNLYDDRVVITIGGITSTLYILGKQQFDVNGDGVNDIEIALNDITGGKATFTMKGLAAPPAEEKPAEEKPKEIPEEKPPVVKVKAPAWIGWLIAGLIVIIGLLIYLTITKKKK